MYIKPHKALINLSNPARHPQPPVKSTTSTPLKTLLLPLPLPLSSQPDDPTPSTSHGSRCFHAPSKLSRSATSFLTPAVLAAGGWSFDAD